MAVAGNCHERCEGGGNRLGTELGSPNIEAGSYRGARGLRAMVAARWTRVTCRVRKNCSDTSKAAVEVCEGICGELEEMVREAGKMEGEVEN